jgi:hypothetical protein
MTARPSQVLQWRHSAFDLAHTVLPGGRRPCLPDAR